MIVLTGGKDASSAYCLTTALYCPLPGQYNAVVRHKTIRRERKNPHSLFYSSLFTKSPETPINTGVPRGEELRATLHLLPVIHFIFSFCQTNQNEYQQLTSTASIPYHSVPISKANLIQYELPIHLHDYHEVYVVCILKVTYHFLPISKSLSVISLTPNRSNICVNP